LVAVAATIIGTAVLAEAPAGGPQIELLGCGEIPRAPGLVRAEVLVTTGAQPFAIDALSCGAFRPRSRNVLFLNSMEEEGEIPARSVRTLHAVFPRDTAHSECRCLMAGAFRMAPPSDWTEAGTPGSETGARVEVDPRPPKEGRPLRWERIVVPGALVRSGPGLRHAAMGTLPENGNVRIYAVHKGWKEVRGLVDGWIPADATSPERSAGAELQGVLADIARHVRSGDQAALCSVQRDRFDDLVFAWQPEHARASLHPTWESLDRDAQGHFQHYATQCLGITELHVIGKDRLAATP
jgi:hypothetical protein